jgi:hypothetical protein
MEESLAKRAFDALGALGGLSGLGQIVGTSGPRQALFLDRRYGEDRRVLLDLRLVALSFAVNALGKRRMRRLLLRRRRPVQLVRPNRGICRV